MIQTVYPFSHWLYSLETEGESDYYASPVDNLLVIDKIKNLEVIGIRSKWTNKDSTFFDKIIKIIISHLIKFF